MPKVTELESGRARTQPQAVPLPGLWSYPQRGNAVIKGPGETGSTGWTPPLAGAGMLREGFSEETGPQLRPEM